MADDVLKKYFSVEAQTFFVDVDAATVGDHTLYAQIEDAPDYTYEDVAVGHLLVTRTDAFLWRIVSVVVADAANKIVKLEVVPHEIPVADEVENLQDQSGVLAVYPAATNASNAIDGNSLWMRFTGPKTHKHSLWN